MKTVTNSKFANWFVKIPDPECQLRSNLPVWKEPFSRTEKIRKSSIPYLTRVLYSLESNINEDNDTVCS